MEDKQRSMTIDLCNMNMPAKYRSCRPSYKEKKGPIHVIDLEGCYI